MNVERSIHHYAFVLIGLLVVLLRGPHVLATPQETVNFASASGRVTDSSGAVVVEAQVIARQTETKCARHILSFVRFGDHFVA